MKNKLPLIIFATFFLGSTFGLAVAKSHNNQNLLGAVKGVSVSEKEADAQIGSSATDSSSGINSQKNTNSTEPAANTSNQQQPSTSNQPSGTPNTSRQSTSSPSTSPKPATTPSTTSPANIASSSSSSPSNAPKPIYGLWFSANGCVLTANGPAGATLEYGSYNEGRGGMDTTTIPSSGTITVTTSGGNGLTTNFANLIDTNGQLLATKTVSVTADFC